ncbi:ESPR-type extended signal peptide-containing protein, partial [Suttonella ornithocola]
MNKIYKTQYNESLGTWVAVPEIAKGKSSSSETRTSCIYHTFFIRPIVAALLMAIGVGASMPAMAACDNISIISMKDSEAYKQAKAANNTAEMKRLEAISGSFQDGCNPNNKNAENSVGIGKWNGVGSVGGIGIGANVLSYGEGSIAIGGNGAAGQGAKVGNSDNKVVTNHSIAIGSTSNIQTSTDAVAIGYASKATGANKSAVLGSTAEATNANSVVLGYGAKDKAYKNVPNLRKNNIDYTSFAGTATGVASVGDNGKERQIVNVAPGAISSTSTDAINGSQLFSVLENGGITFANGDNSGSISSTATNSKNKSSLVKFGNKVTLTGAGTTWVDYDPNTNTYTITSKSTSGSANALSAIQVNGDSGSAVMLNNSNNVIAINGDGKYIETDSDSNTNNVVIKTDKLETALNNKVNTSELQKLTFKVDGGNQKVEYTPTTEKAITLKGEEGTKVTLADDGTYTISTKDLKDQVKANETAIAGNTTNISTNTGAITNLQKGWKIQAAADGGKLADNSTKDATKVGADDTVTFKAGKNITLARNDRDITISLADDAKQEVVTQIDGNAVKTLTKTNNTANFITGDNITLTNENGGIKVATKKDVLFDNINVGPITINKDNGINMGDKKITNVAAPTEAGDVANKKYVDDSITKQVANVETQYTGDNGTVIVKRKPSEVLMLK